MAFDGYNGSVSGECPTLGVNCGMSTGRNGVMFAAGFKASQGAKAGGIGYEAERAATLTAKACAVEPSVLVETKAETE